MDDFKTLPIGGAEPIRPNDGRTRVGRGVYRDSKGQLYNNAGGVIKRPQQPSTPMGKPAAKAPPMRMGPQVPVNRVPDINQGMRPPINYQPIDPNMNPPRFSGRASFDMPQRQPMGYGGQDPQDPGDGGLAQYMARRGRGGYGGF